MSGWHHEGVFKEKQCVVCGTDFKPKSGIHKFCSVTCKGKWKYITGRVTTESQYKEISGNWKRYLNRLVTSTKRKKDGLTRDMLIQKLKEQNYKCALSGVQLTCDLSKGDISQTNASVDRIIAGGDYTYDNIQLVCKTLNSFRNSTPLDDFVNWCKKVVEYQSR